MDDNHSRQRSLGDQVRWFMGLPPTQSTFIQDRDVSIDRHSWFAILNDSDQTARFMLSLSALQLSSHQLLRGWLSGRCEDTHFDEDAKEAERAVALERQSGYSKPVAQSPSYHYRLAQLFFFEFSFPGEGTPSELHLAILQQVRRDAALYASCQRIATTYYREAVRRVTESDLPLPRRQEQFPTPYGASVDPCSWLNTNSIEDDGLPFYLWDVKKKITRTFKEIGLETGAIPDYVAISHTWGRWAKDDDPSLVELHSVPWKIPQNETFCVEDLPEALQKLPFEYIWLDLLTIPQKDITKELADIQKTEIGRQASIFRNAIRVVAWLHDVSDWSSLPKCLHYLSLNFLKSSPATNVDQDLLSSLLSDAFTSAPSSMEFCQPKTERSHTARNPNPWFTSLWTLQETCLRPDMLLCTADWNFLEISKDLPVALNDIVALCLANSSPPIAIDTHPVAVQELIQIMSKTGLVNLLQLSQLSIITMGNDRHCLERRAEAIMSAIGATDWFKGVSEEQREKDLIIDLYPRPFVDEIRRKIGNAAFFSPTPMGWEFHYVLRKFCSEKRTARRKFEELGSLLPFGPGARHLAFDIESLPHMVEHPALQFWSIQDSACVKILQAGIVCSSSPDGKPAVPIRCILAAPSSENDENKLIIQENVDLQEWICSYKPESSNFAVCILHSPLSSRGIILRQMEEGILLKIGSYWQMERPRYTMPESQPVDWLVM